MTQSKMTKTVLGCALAGTMYGGTAMAQTYVVDLTHPIPTFQAMEGDPMKADLSKPWRDSRPIPTFGGQTVLTLANFPTNRGDLPLGTLVLAEHHGTHLDTSAHYANKPDTLESGFLPGDKRKRTHELGAGELVGRVVLIDISGRVQAELDKNGGVPSPDRNVTDFSNSSQNVVTADDIEAVAHKLGNGSWLVMNTGWSRFYFDGADFGTGPYVNGFNHPGITPAAVDKLIEVLEQRGVKINGLVADNISIDSGESTVGIDDKFTDSLYAHMRLLQRGLLFVENAANLGQLALAKPDSCTLVVGAPKHVHGTGGPSRVFAMCEQ